MTNRLSMCVLPAALCALLLTGCLRQQGPPYEPEAALATFQVAPGFRIELAAAEPQVTDPVDMAFDPDGRLYVVEMPDYPADETDAVTSRIKLLEDHDGDGYYETATVFAEDLPFVNGVMPWRGGVLVTKAPDILYFEDTDGDNQADVRRVVLSGFAATNPQLRMSNLEYGVDNWIYGAYSRAGGARRYPQFADHGRALHFPEAAASDSFDIYPGTDFRFRPEAHVVEAAGGMSQFGNAFDADGNRFTVWNNKHIRHVVIPGRYLTRNPYLRIDEVMSSVPEHGGAATVYPITEDPLNLHESEIGHFTSACGMSIYTGDLFPGDYRQSAFVCEPVHNLIHGDLLRPTGPTFTGRRPQAEAEFVASTDSWFRPVNTTVGPDGALYVADFYRKLVEHPTFIARADSQGLYTFAGMLQEDDFSEGQDRGRIYRVVPEGYTADAAPRPKLSAASATELVAYLDEPVLWWRLTAQRLLVHRQDASAVPALEEMARADRHEGRMHALWTLEGLGRLDDALILQALNDRHPGVRQQAVVLAEARLDRPDVRDKLLTMAGDTDARVQFRLALVLGGLPPAQSFPALREIALAHIDDPWFQTAVLTGAAHNPLDWLAAVHQVEASSEVAAAGKESFLRRIASVVGARRDGDEIAAVLAAAREAATPRWQGALLDGLGEGLRQDGSQRASLSGPAQRDLLHLIETLPEAGLAVGRLVAWEETDMLRRARAAAFEQALAADAPVEARTQALRLLGMAPRPATLPALAQLLTPRHPSQVQQAAAEVLTAVDDTAATSMLLTHWDAYTSSVRDVVERGMLGRTERTVALLSAVETGAVEPEWMSRATRQRLVRHPDARLRARAEAALGPVDERSREEVIRRYHEASRGRGDAAAGEQIFAAACSVCHRAGEAGYEVGPDLTSLTNRTRIDLMTQILDPNDNIAPGYEGYVVETTDGRSLTGVMARENAAGVILRAAGGLEHSVLRKNIAAIRPMDTSVMPADWEQRLSVDDMANLLEYLKSLR